METSRCWQFTTSPKQVSSANFHSTRCRASPDDASAGRRRTTKLTLLYGAGVGGEDLLAGTLPSSTMWSHHTRAIVYDDRYRLHKATDAKVAMSDELNWPRRYGKAPDLMLCAISGREQTTMHPQDTSLRPRRRGIACRGWQLRSDFRGNIIVMGLGCRGDAQESAESWRGTTYADWRILPREHSSAAFDGTYLLTE